MDYEKKYKEALKLARSFELPEYRNIMASVFPELKESEDERIRKEIINFIKSKFESSCAPTPSKKTLADWANWLEKQDKCNSINVDKMVSEYSQTKDGAWGLPVNCQIKAYRQGINDVLNLTVLKNQDKQSPDIQWHSANEEPKEGREIFCEWEGSDDATWHDIVYYQADTKDFWCVERKIKGVVKWAYVYELLGKQRTV